VSGAWSATSRLCGPVWRELLVRAIFECGKWDVHQGDGPVLAPYALVLAPAHWARVAEIAERLAAEAIEIERELLVRPDLHSELGLPRSIRAVLRKIPRHWAARGARVMRFDFHLTAEGWRISEVNSDVPGGFIESSGFSELLGACFPGLIPAGNPSRAYAEAIRRSAGSGAHIALVHATGYSDDRQVMEYLARHLRALGLRATLLSPSHLRFDGRRPEIQCRFASGNPDGIVRFFPAEWLPKLGRRQRWAGFFASDTIALSNPATALLLQTKRMPLVWDCLASPVAAWRAWLPQVSHPSGIPESEREEWVLKPALGRVGESVAIAGVTAPREFQRIVRLARRRPSAYAAQRRFRAAAVETPDGPRYPCLGVFTVDGRTAGCYGRVSPKPLTDGEAQDVAVLIESGNRNAT